MNSDDIRSLIPHRYPFLFIETAEILTDTSARGTARWPADHVIFQGHFPGLPIVPGVCQIEAAAQLAGVVAAEAGRRKLISGIEPEQAVGVLGGVRKALFHAPLFPDEVLDLTVELRNGLGAMGLASGTGFRGAVRIITFELSLGFASRSAVEKALADAGRLS